MLVPTYRYELRKAVSSTGKPLRMRGVVLGTTKADARATALAYAQRRFARNMSAYIWRVNERKRTEAIVAMLRKNARGGCEVLAYQYVFERTIEDP